MAVDEGEAAMKNLSDKTNYDRLQKDIEVVKDDILNMAEQLTAALNSFAGTAQTQARRSYRQARDNVDSLVSDLGRQGSEAFESAQDAAVSIGESLEDAVQERPFAAIGLALGLGFLIGVTWRR